MNSPVILITGAGKGIGKAVVEGIISRKGAMNNPRLVLVSRTKADLEPLEKQARAAGLECEILPFDFTIDPKMPVAYTVKKFGSLDQVIHSAGVGAFGHFLELTREQLDYTIQTNVTGSFLFLQAAYAQMKSQKSETEEHKGDIVWITSVAAERPFEHSAIYSMSKYAQRGLLDVMRLYGRADGIRIIDVRPGATLTPMWGDVPPEQRKRMMEADDIAQIILDALALNPRASAEEIVIRPLHGDI